MNPQASDHGRRGQAQKTTGTGRHRGVLAALVLLALGSTAASVPAGDAADAHAHHGHHHGATGPAAVRSLARYRIPDVTLTDSGGRPVPLRDVLADPSPVLVNFIFTSCTSICPVMSGVFAQVHARLDSLDKPARLVSISIDPEYDTPARLAAYAAGFGAGPRWMLLTGRLEDSVAVQRAFDAYRGDKMNHVPATFLRAAPDQPWVRLDGIASADDLVVEYRHLTGR